MFNKFLITGILSIDNTLKSTYSLIFFYLLLLLSLKIRTVHETNERFNRKRHIRSEYHHFTFQLHALQILLVEYKIWA